MRIAVVDDDADMRGTLGAYLTRFADESGMTLNVFPFAGGEGFLSRYTDTFDVIILDIDMPGINGIDVARAIRDHDEDVTIMFVTSMAQYALNGFEVQAVDYIVKPVSYPDFALKFRRATRMAQRSAGQAVVIDTNDGPRRLSSSDITYVEVYGHYLLFHTVGGLSYRARGSMADIVGELDGCGFCRIHKSFMVNMRHVGAVRASELSCGGRDLPVGRAYKDGFLHTYTAYLTV